MLKKKNNSGFSIIELLVVLAIGTVMVTFTMLALNGRRLHNTDDQAYIVLDFMKEARQRALSQREVMRVEINRDTGSIRLMNENDSATANDDVEVRSYEFVKTKQVIYDKAPDNMTGVPTAVSPIPPIVFKASTHPTSTPDNVATIRFLPNGNITDAGTTAIASNATSTGATIYFWTPIKDQDGQITDDGEVIRAITILGASGSPSYRSCPVANGQCLAWNQ